AVLDHDGLSERLRQVLRQDAGRDIDRPTRREGHDHLDRPRGVGRRLPGGAEAAGNHENCRANDAFAEHELLQRSGGAQSTLMPVSFAIVAQRGAWAAMKAAKSCGGRFSLPRPTAQSLLARPWIEGSR